MSIKYYTNNSWLGKKNHKQVHHEIEKISSKQSLKIIILFEIKCIQNKITATMCFERKKKAAGTKIFIAKLFIKQEKLKVTKYLKNRSS